MSAILHHPGGMADVAREFDCDTALPYAVVPPEIWTVFGLEPSRRQSVTLPDGTAVDRAVAECEMTILARRAVCVVFLGEPGDHPTMGFVTLSQFGFVLDPFSRKARETVYRA